MASDVRTETLSNERVETVDTWILMGTPVPVLTLCVFYLIFVVWMGPRLMSNRKPMTIKKTIILYNIAQVCMTGYIVIQPILRPALRKTIVDCCRPTHQSKMEYKDDLQYIAWLYFVSKIADLLDTVFFVLRKKHRQITFLHVWHHFGMVISTWGYLKFFIDNGSGFVAPLIVNSLVHVIMYTYYLLSALGPAFQKYLWWKKYMTRIQLLQFAWGICYVAALYYYECHISKTFAIYIIINVLFLIGLFTNFYIQTYRKDKAKDSL